MPLKSYKLIRTYADGSDGGVLGFVNQTSAGWRFNPNVAGRTPSRKDHASFDAAIPRWTGHPDRTRSQLIEKGSRP